MRHSESRLSSVIIVSLLSRFANYDGEKLCKNIGEGERKELNMTALVWNISNADTTEPNRISSVLEVALMARASLQTFRLQACSTDPFGMCS